MVVRYRTGQSSPALTDALGKLLESSADALVVRTRRGPVRIARGDVVAAKAVPPPPTPRLPEIGVEELALLSAAGWPAPDVARLGDWWLRAGAGFTRRANSVLAVGGPGTGWSTALDRARDWYAERGLPLLVQLAETEQAALLHPALRAAGLRPGHDTLMLTAATATVAQSPDPGPVVGWGEQLDAGWLVGYARQRPLQPPVSDQILGAEGAQLARVDVDGELVALARLSLDPTSTRRGWGGVSCLWVDPVHRGRGLGRALTRAAAVRAEAAGVERMYLQVVPDNTVALALYARLGFTEHHRYRYWSAPDTVG